MKILREIWNAVTYRAGQESSRLRVSGRSMSADMGGVPRRSDQPVWTGDLLLLDVDRTGRRVRLAAVKRPER